MKVLGVGVGVGVEVGLSIFLFIRNEVIGGGNKYIILGHLKTAALTLTP